MTSISVVIPAWNDAALLKSCLAALARQTRPADEIIVVDNASSDDTAGVARAAGARVVTEPVRGILPSTVAGFDAAGGEIIARLDADSIPPANWLEHVEAVLVDAPPLSAVTGPGDFYGANRIVCWLGRVAYIGGYFWAIGALLGHPPMFGSNMAIDSSIWERIRSTVDPALARVHDDLHLSFRIEPDMTVVYDKTLRVAISARPFDSWGTLGKRLRWSWTTIRLNARATSLRKRRAERRAWLNHPPSRTTPAGPG